MSKHEHRVTSTFPGSVDRNPAINFTTFCGSMREARELVEERSHGTASRIDGTFRDVSGNEYELYVDALGNTYSIYR